MDATEKEILIGLSDREETETALEKTGGKFTYNISFIGDKICVAAPTVELLGAAMDLLETEYFSKSAGDGKVALPENMDYTPAEFKHLTIIDKGTCNYSVMFPSNAGMGTPVNVAASEIAALLQDHTNEEQEVEISRDYIGQYDVDTPAIVLGNTSYPRSGELAEGMKYFGWKMKYLDNQYYLFTEDTVSIKVMKEKVLTTLKDGIYFEDTQTIRILMPEEESGYYNTWCHEVPQYAPLEGETIVSQPISEFTEGYYRLYLGGISPDGAAAYNNLMKASGYTVYQERSVTTYGKTSTFVTYEGKDTMVHVYYLASQKAMRVLICEKSDFIRYATQPEALGEKIYNVPYMTIMDLEYAKQANKDNGLGLIFTLEDGSFIIYDGGYAYDTEKMYNYLRDNNNPNSDEIHIRAWIITHPHQDHYGNFLNFAYLYGNHNDNELDETVKLDYVVYQFDYETAMNPSMTSIGNSESKSLQRIFEDVEGSIGCFPAAKVIVPLAGQTMYFGNVAIEMLATSEMTYKDGVTSGNQNDHSLISRVTMNGETVLITGDAANAYDNLKTIVDVFGYELESTFMTAPHHGLNGNTSLYQIASPKYVIFHTDKIHHDERLKEDGASAAINAVLIEQLKLAIDDPNRFLIQTIYAEEGGVNGYHKLRMPFNGFDEYDSNFQPGDFEDGDVDEKDFSDLANS